MNFKPLVVFCDCTVRLFGKVDKYKLLKTVKEICVHTKILEYWRVRFSFLYLVLFHYTNMPLHYAMVFLKAAKMIFFLFLIKTQIVGTR